MIGRYLERLAEWYLERRGRMVLPRMFFGMAIGGYASAFKIGGTGQYDEYQVMIMKGSQLIAMTNSIITDTSKNYAVIGNPRGAGGGVEHG